MEYTCMFYVRYTKLSPATKSRETCRPLVKSCSCGTYQKPRILQRPCWKEGAISHCSGSHVTSKAYVRIVHVCHACRSSNNFLLYKECWNNAVSMLRLLTCRSPTWIRPDVYSWLSATIWQNHVLETSQHMLVFLKVCVPTSELLTHIKRIAECKYWLEDTGVRYLQSLLRPVDP